MKSQEEETQEQILQSWDEKINDFKTKFGLVHSKVVKDARKVEDETQIDVAFFYAEPIA